MDPISVLGLQQFNSDDFYVNTLSDHLKTSHSHIEKPHKHNFFATFLFTHGSGVHEIDFNKYDVKPGSVFLLSPGQTHNWTLSGDCDGFVFFHSQEFYETHYLNETLRDYRFFSSINNRAAIFLDSKEANDIVGLFNKLLSENREEIRAKQMILSLVTQIYIELERLISVEVADLNAHHIYYIKFLQFQRLVEEKFKMEKSAAKYADMMNITPKHLNRINKQVVNKTTSEIINDRLILEAKRLLIFGNQNFSEVGLELGFDDYSHFSKMFKNKTGMSPGGFLKSFAS